LATSRSVRVSASGHKMKNAISVYSGTHTATSAVGFHPTFATLGFVEFVASKLNPCFGVQISAIFVFVNF